MKESTTRRLFLQKTAMATTGLALVSSNVVSAFSSESPFEGYNPFSEEKTDLRTSLFEKHVRVKGVLYDKTGATPVSNATIEVWHLSPNSTKYRHRGKLKTNDAGEYNFITDFPNKVATATARIYFKINYRGQSYFTELAVGDKIANITSKHWEENQHLRDKLYPTSEQFLTTTTINFNLSIN
jgi:protocatechuate 3,4-dioxygenase beta subunit